MKDEELVREAHDRFADLEDQERKIRQLWIEDVKFAHGDSDNNWQWDQEDLYARKDRTNITVNKVKQHNRQITNDARQNQVSIKIKPEGNGAHEETAKIIQGLIRHIEKNSKAETAYDIAFDFAVDGGIGYWYVTTDYIDNESNDKEIKIRPIPNPLNVYMCEGEEFDGSDSPYAFIFKDMRKEEFKAKYGEDIDTSGWGDTETEWVKKDKIRIAHYYKVIEKNDRLYFNEQGQSIKLSEVEDKEAKKALKASGLKSRPIKNKKVVCYLIAGNTIIDQYDWLGTTIPIVPCKGEEKIIDGELYRAGNTRLIKDSQRMLNYYKSCDIEFKKLQGKTPWVGAYEAFEGFEELYDTANNINHARLVYNHKDANGDQIPAPQRTEPPVSSQAYLDGMDRASKDMQEVSGQFDAQMGENVNQQSGKALLAVQSRGLVSTFNFIDNKARSLKRTGEILVEVMPLTYDIAQIKRIIGEDEKEEEVQIDPEQPEAYQEFKGQDGKLQKIFNPGIGRYVVDVQVGQNYGTKRQESFNALTEVAKSDPRFMQIAGDLYLEMADFPLSDAIAERYRKALPPEMQEKEEGQPEIPQEIQQKIQDAEAIIKKLDETIQGMSAELESKEIDKANAETNILKVAAQYMPPEAVATIAMQLLTDLKFSKEIQQQVQPQQQQVPQQPPMQ